MTMFLGKHKVFPSIQDVDEVLTAEWMEAASAAAEIVGMMGKQFSMTRDDMLGNIKKVTAKYETDKEQFKKFKDILLDEKNNKKDKDDKSATVGGLWLKRGLEYLCEVFRELIREHDNSKLPGNKSDNSAVKKACQVAYDKTLYKHHGLATRMVVKGALQLSPYKETLMKNLREGQEEMTVDELVDQMKVYEEALREYVILVCKIFLEIGHKDKDEPLVSGKVVQEEQQQQKS